MKEISEIKINNLNNVFQQIIKNITFPVAIRLVSQILKELFPEKTNDELYDMILFKTSESLSFQKSDIYDVLFIKNKDMIRVEITLGFLSIFGASSPLPTHYNERVLEDSYNIKVLVDFLEMLNHRLKRLIYPIWEKQRYYVTYEKNLSDKFSKYLLSMLGVNKQVKDQMSIIDFNKLLPFSGILNMHQKSATSLLTILRAYFNHDEIYIEEGIMSKTYFPSEQYLLIGKQNICLGEETYLGSFVLTRHLKYRIHFNNITWENLLDFMLEKKKKYELYALIQLIQKNELSYDLSLNVMKNEVRLPILGKENLYLGCNIWIGNNNNNESFLIEM